jgi:threonine dehydratase
VPARHEQYVPREQRTSIKERHAGLILEDEIRRDLASHDFAKHAHRRLIVAQAAARRSFARYSISMTEFDAVLAARDVIAGRLVRTPVQRLEGELFSPALAGVELVFKLEMFQRTGSFKIRGALNKLASLPAEAKSRGVIGMSSGNHAQALAYGARLEGVPATVVMPDFSVPGKVAATKAYGATVILVPATELFATYERLRDEQGLAAVHPFDDPYIIAGAGTAAIELLEEEPDLDLAVAGVGGGGWISGTATAIKGRSARTRVVGVEPEGAPVVRRSLDAGKLVRLESVKTVADGLAPPFTGPTVFDRIQRLVDDVVLVNDAEIVTALKLLIERLKAVVEPSAAACFAGLLSGRIPVGPGQRVGVLLSGGNVDAARLSELLATASIVFTTSR